MKKSLLALAVLGAFAGVASAQSSVTLYGTVDLNAKYVKNDGSVRRVSLSQDGINSSQLGIKGTEDLGGGLKAGFVLLCTAKPRSPLHILTDQQKEMREHRRRKKLPAPYS